MLRLVLLLLVAISLAVAARPAHAGRFTCKAAQNLARAAAPDRDAVIPEPDEVKRECRFSINGEPAGSPPREVIMQSMALMRLGLPSEALIVKTEVDWLAFILLAASTTNAIDDSFRDQLRTHAKELGGCFKALEANAPLEVPAFDNRRDLFCRAAARGGAEFSFQGKYWLEAVTSVPNLVIGAMRKDGASYLFVPFGLFRPQR